VSILFIPNSNGNKKISSMIQNWGYTLDTLAHSDSQVHELVQKTDCRIVLIEITVPLFLTCDIIHELKKIKPDIKIITMTDSSDPEMETTIRETGIVYYLTQPFDPQELKTVLKHLSGQKQPPPSIR